MYLDPDDRRPALTPQLALRVAMVGGVALVAFALIFFRLWYLQVLSGDKYEAEAKQNQVRKIIVRAPRGEIVDRDGRVLVDNRVGLAIKVSPKGLPRDPARRADLYGRLARLLGMKPGDVLKDVKEQLDAVPYSTATVRADAPRPVIQYVLENKADFPGVEVERVFLRLYPHGEVGAHLFGTVGELNAEQRKSQRYRGAALGDRVGQNGIEAQYDRFLRGRNGGNRVQVDAFGTLRRGLGRSEPQQGRQLRLSVDIDVQRAGQRALGGAKGAFVAMNVSNGEVLGLGSSPSFDPNLFSKVIRQRDLDQVFSKDNGEPYLNRATQGLYPTGSTFKLITATAALEGGLITPDTVQYDGGSLKVGTQEFENAGKVVNGPVALRKALSVSSDVFFYRLGQEANGSGNGLLIQDWARRLGLGHTTGIDLPGEAGGLVPTPKWRNDAFAAHQRCIERKRPTPQQISYGDCNFIEKPWTVGDNINLSVGQGDLLADPLQLAVAYAAIANGGRVVRPRLGQRIEDAGGRPLQELEAPPARKLKIREEYRQAILDGLRSAASDPGGTSAPVFQGFKIPVAGKTGTAQHKGHADQSWYVALAPYPSPKYVVAVTFEEGGFGAETAAPAARAILAELFGVADGGPPAKGTAPN